ncbi:MAG: triple tyrosine motif-containing protein [Steroidobacteraceae bacterium]
MSARRCALVAWCGCVWALWCAPASAISPDLEVWQLYHTSWTARDGAPTGIVSITQTLDGYLWLATATGLFRFDGVRFERFDGASGVRLPSSNVFSLFATPSGDLWIGYMFGGVSVVRNGHITNYTERDGLPTASVRAIAQDPTGATWVATSLGLLRFDGRRWEHAGGDWNGPHSRTTSFAVDGAGTMWAIADESAFYLLRGARRFERAKIPSVSFDRAEISVAPDGTAWLFDSVAGAFSLDIPAATDTQLDSRRLRLQEPDQTNAMLIDREGGVWRRSAKGLRRFNLESARKAGAIGAGVSANAPIMTSDYLMDSFEDREGNVWFGTAGGLDKFREPRLREVELLPKGTDAVLSVGERSTMWIGSGFGQLTAFGSTMQPESKATLPHNISAMYLDPCGVLWVGGSGGLWRKGPASDPRMTGPFGDPELLKTDIQSIAMDGSGSLWVSVVRAGVFRIDAGDRWTLWGGRSDLPAEPATILAADAKGSVWLGYTQNRIVRLDAGEAATYSGQDGLDLGTVLALNARRGNVWAGGERGLARFDGRRFQSVTGRSAAQTTEGDGRFFTSVTGIVETASGELWLNTGEGAIHIDAEQVRQLVSDPQRPVRYDLLDYLDGMPGVPPAIRPIPTIAEGGDGQLWFSTTNGVVRIDPKHIKLNEIKPNVVIESITADRVQHDNSSDVLLPMKTRNLQIAYTALSLTIPERVQFRYRLHGVDTSWQDVGTRRVAYYTDLEPGNYRFQVVASNNDNLWNDEGASIGFVIPPTFVQTRVFLALCILASATAVWMLFRFRLRQIDAINRWRLEERLVERERIARELHDTFLQGVQGLILRFQSAAERIPEHEPARCLMEQALDRADQVLAEGRDRVTDLRTSTYAPTDLVETLQRVGDDLTRENAATFRLTVEGESRTLHPAVLEEACRIGAEAITNAFNHARAQHISVHIVFGSRNLTLRVKDDGAGFESAVARARQSAGHWGLTGMQERAAHIRARFDISSRVEEGTTVDLRVPAPIAYSGAESPRSWRFRWGARRRGRSSV